MKQTEMQDIISQYDIIYESPARRWEDGLPFGNGSIGGLAYAPLHPQWVINKNDVYDYRWPNYKWVNHSQVVKMAAEGKGPRDLDKLEAADVEVNEAKPDEGKFPCPKTCGQIRIRPMRPSIFTPPPRISQRLCLHESSVLFNLDKHLAHPRITSFVHAEQDILVIRMKDVSAMAGFNNNVEIWREPDSMIPDARPYAQGDFIWLEQKFHDSFRYVMAAKIVPRGGNAYLNLFKKSVRKMWWHVGEPSKKIEGRVEAKYAIAPVAGEFDVFLTVVTSFDSKNPLAEAKKRLNAVAAEGFNSLQKSHRRWWADFWSKSWIELNDDFKNQLWYASVHALGSAIRKPPAPGLCGLWYGPMDTPSQILPWLGVYTNDYNMQVPATPVFRINHPEIAEVFLRTVRHQLPQVKKDTRRLYGWPGAMYPLATDPTGRTAGGGMRYCQCAGPFWGIFFWWHYLYTKDKKFLEEVSYPVLHEVATFFQHAMRFNNEDRRYHLELSIPPEFLYFKYPDSSFTLATLKYTIKATIAASEVLGKDSQKRKKWRHLLENFPDYPTDAGVITAARGMPANHFEQLFSGGAMLAFPCAEADSEINPDAYKLALRSLKHFLGKHNTYFRTYSTSKGINMYYTGISYAIGTAAQWLGLHNVSRRMLRDILRCHVKPSGLITHNFPVWAPSRRSEENIKNVPDGSLINDDGDEPIPYSEILSGLQLEECTEDPACKEYIFPALEGPGTYLLTIGEMLLQSHNGIIRLFPGYRRNESASFYRFMAEGPILVSSQYVKGKIRFIKSEGLVKTNVRIKNPWPGQDIWFISSKSNKPKKVSFDKYIEFEIGLRESATLAPTENALKEADSLAPKLYSKAKPRLKRFSDGTVTWLGKPLIDPYTGPKMILKKEGEVHP